jgi:tetratricopeptide (TPR) repeat protein
MVGYGGKKRVADMKRRLTAALGGLGLLLISSHALAQPPPREVPPCPRGYILDFKAAVKGCSEVIRENPQAAWAYYVRGSANSAMGKTSLAIADLTKAIELEPGNAPYLLFRALLFLHDNAFEHAIADANKSIELNPTSADGYLGRAIIHGKSGNFEGAAQDCNHALKIDPETGESCKRVLALPPTAK